MPRSKTTHTRHRAAHLCALISAAALLSVLVSAQPSSEDVEVRRTILDSQLQNIVWCGNNEEDDYDVLVLTREGTVYRSSDRGEKWESLKQIVQNSAVKALNDINAKWGKINQILKSPVDPNLVFFLGSEGVQWVSEDCGQSVRALARSKHIRDLQFHPTERTWALASAWNNCYEKSATERQKLAAGGNATPRQNCVVSKELYVTFDLGKTWQFVTNFITQYAWGMRSNKNNDKIPKERILVSQDSNPQGGHQRMAGWSVNTHLLQTDDFFQTKKVLVNKGNKFLVTQSFFFVAQVQSAEEQHVRLLVANPNAYEYEFRYADVQEELRQHSFTILDTSEGQVFININHHRANAPLGNIYTSDSTGTRFGLSVSDNVKDPISGQCDFEKVTGLDGVYLANVYEGRLLEQYKQLVEEAAAMSASGNGGSGDGADNEDDDFEIQEDHKRDASGKSGSGDSGSATIAQRIKEATDALQKARRTRISFDKGGIWKPLSPPIKDANGKRYQCDTKDDCALHLHSVSSKMHFGPFYTTENSVGIVMGTGNIGKFLSEREDVVNTYLSRDAGLTWYEVKKGSHIYEIGDHGAIIVLAPNTHATDKIYYSWDEGLTWQEKEIYSEPIEITNIVTEPSNIAQRFIVYGTVQSNSGAENGVVLSIDFENLHRQQCVGSDQPDTDDSDYETWTPNGRASPDCLLGRKVTYVRRKRESQCFNGEEFEREIRHEQCECTEEDWECDLGFERKGDGPCEPIDGADINYQSPDVCDGYYLVTQGYRKVAGDTCVGGIDHKAIKIPCPMFGFLSANNFYNLVFVIFCLSVVYGIYKHRTKVAEFIEKTVVGLGSITARRQRGAGGSDALYMDFSNMQFENNAGGQFDADLIESADEEQPGGDGREDDETGQLRASQQQADDEDAITAGGAATTNNQYGHQYTPQQRADVQLLEQVDQQ